MALGHLRLPCGPPLRLDHLEPPRTSFTLDTVTACAPVFGNKVVAAVSYRAADKRTPFKAKKCVV